MIRQRVVLSNLHYKSIARFLHHLRSDEQIEHTAEHTLVFWQDIQIFPHGFRLDEFTDLASPPQLLQCRKRIEPRQPLKVIQQINALARFHAFICQIFGKRHQAVSNACRIRKEVGREYPVRKGAVAPDGFV